MTIQHHSLSLIRGVTMSDNTRASLVNIIDGSKHHTFAKSVRRLLKKAIFPYNKFRGTVYTVVHNSYSCFSQSAPHPVAMLSSDAKNIFPGLKLSGGRLIGELDDIQVVVFPEVSHTNDVYSAVARGTNTHKDFVSWFSSIYNQYLRDIEDPVKVRKWDTPNRIRRRVWSAKSMTIAQYLQEYTMLGGAGNSAVIRDMADLISAEIIPPTLLYADSPSDFKKLYASGPDTCMRVGGRSATREWEVLMSDCGIHPTSWYAFCPYTRGAYTERKNLVHCRTILHLHKGGWYYGRMYTPTEVARKQFIDSLEAAGYRRLPGAIDTGPSQSWSQPPDKFSVPGVVLKDGRVVCPFPYIDNMRYEFYVKYDKDAGAFIFVARQPSGTYPEGFTPANSGTRSCTVINGMITVFDCSPTVCAHCGTAWTAQRLREDLGLDMQSRIHSRTGKMYCQSECAEAADVVSARRSDSLMLLVDKEDAIYDTQNNQYFSNPTSAARSGVYEAAVRGVLLLDEEPSYSDSGRCSSVSCNGRVVIIRDQLTFSLANNREDSSTPIATLKITTVKLESIDIYKKEEHNEAAGLSSATIAVLDDLTKNHLTGGAVDIARSLASSRPGDVFDVMNDSVQAKITF